MATSSHRPVNINCTAYSRIVLLLMKCTATVERRVLQTYLTQTGQTITQLLTSKSKAISSKQVGKANQAVLFPPNNQTTDIEIWDMSLLCCVLSMVLQHQMKQDIEQLRDLRNRICHCNNGSLDETEYKIFKTEIMQILDQALTYVNDEQFKKETYYAIEEVENSSLLDPIPLYRCTMNQWYALESDIRDKLEEMKQENVAGHQTIEREIVNSSERVLNEQKRARAEASDNASETKALQKETQQEVSKLKSEVEELRKENRQILTTLNEVVRCMPSDLQPPDAALTFETKCQHGVDELLVNKFKSEVKQNGSCLTSTDDEFKQVEDATKEICMEMEAHDQPIEDAENGSVRLIIRCKSFPALASLLDECTSGKLTERFKPLETAIRKLPGFEGYSQNVIMRTEDLTDILQDLAERLSNYKFSDGLRPEENPGATIPKATDMTKRMFSSTQTIDLAANPNEVYDEYVGYTRILMMFMQCVDSVQRRVLETYLMETDQTLSELVASNRSPLLSSPIGSKNEHILFPPNNLSTNIELWDITLVCCILVLVCKLPRTQDGDLDKVRDVKDKFDRMKEPLLKELEYKWFLGKIKNIVTHSLEYIKNHQFNLEMQGDIDKIEHSSGSNAALEYMLNRRTNRWYHTEHGKMAKKEQMQFEHEPTVIGISTETGKARLLEQTVTSGIAEQLGTLDNTMDEDSADFEEMPPPMTRGPNLRFDKDITLSPFGITGICNLSDKHLIGVSLYSVTLLDKITGKVNSSKNNFMPFDVTCVSENSIAVTLPINKLIQYMSISDSDSSSDVMKEKERIKVDGECCGIQYYNDTLIVSFINTANVQVLDMNGTCLRMFTADASGRPLFGAPLCIALSPDHDTVYVTDEELNTVTALTMTGKVKSVVRDDIYQQYRVGVTVDANGNVYVCDRMSKTVNLVCTDIGSVTPLLTIGDDSRCIDYCTGDNKLYVGTDKGHVKVFDVIKQ